MQESTQHVKIYKKHIPEDIYSEYKSMAHSEIINSGEDNEYVAFHTIDKATANMMNSVQQMMANIDPSQFQQ